MTSAAANIPTPGNPVRHQAGAFVLTLAAVESGAYVFTVEYASTGQQVDYLRRSGTYDAIRAIARNAYRFFAAGGRPEDLEQPATVTLAAPAKGTQTKVTDPGMQALAYAIAAGGYIRRGGHEGEAPVTVLKALAKRGHLDPTVEVHGRRKVIVGGQITRAGRIAHLHVTGADQHVYALSA